MPGKRPTRRGGDVFNVYAAETALGWRVIGRTSPSCAVEKITSGQWREVFYESGELAGYQIAPVVSSMRTALPDRLTDQWMASSFGPPTITLSEVKMNAGLFGRSRTLGKPEWKRRLRRARYDREKILSPEDAIERAIGKVKQWPYPASRIDDGSGEPVYGDKAIRVYPIPPKR